MVKAADIARAIEIFARGCAFTKSFTHPCVAEKIDGLWVFRDAPRKRVADYRREEWIANGVPAEKVDAIARKHTRGRFAICAIRGVDEPEAPLRAAYKSLGYRLGATEPLMINPLTRIPKLPKPFPIERITTMELADKLAKITRRRQVLPEHLKNDSPLRHYVALDGGQPVGWVKSISVAGASWVADMFVNPKYRRRGIGKSLLVKMLEDVRSAGAKNSALLASHTGALMYPHVGYEMIGMLYLYTPKKR